MADEDPRLRAMYEEFKALDSDSADFEVIRDTVQEGRTFSKEAMDAATEAIITFIGARIMARWERTNEPPTAVRITVKVEAR